MFDLSMTKLLVLAVIALIVFGPNELPKIARQAGRALRDLRRIAEGAKEDLREGLGPEFQDFEFDDLNPRRFVQRHLLDDMSDDLGETKQALSDEFGTISDALTVTPNGGAAGTADASMASAMTGNLLEGETPPFDTEAT